MQPRIPFGTILGLSFGTILGLSSSIQQRGAVATEEPPSVVAHLLALGEGVVIVDCMLGYLLRLDTCMPYHYHHHSYYEELFLLLPLLLL